MAVRSTLPATNRWKLPPNCCCARRFPGDYDETNRSLQIPGTQGDATLRSFMNWDELATNAERNGYRTQDVLAHWQKLGRSPAVHTLPSARAYTPCFPINPTPSNAFFNPADLKMLLLGGWIYPKGKRKLLFRAYSRQGTMLQDYYSGQQVRGIRRQSERGFGIWYCAAGEVSKGQNCKWAKANGDHNQII